MGNLDFNADEHDDPVSFDAMPDGTVIDVEIEATELKDWLPVFPGGGQLPLPKVLRQPELLWAILRNSGTRPKKPG